MEQGHTEEAVGSAEHIIEHACIAINWGSLEKFARENRVHKGPLQGPYHTCLNQYHFDFYHNNAALSIPSSKVYNHHSNSAYSESHNR